ncbi:MAG: TetR/AcrR family transcriptional regulator [Erysipelotrichaceae bacterium]|nr:TetR/AcrR family transcriptional regulator [Erysipelotrichaceae bacterium]
MSQHAKVELMNALYELLKKNSFESLTCNQIIEKANVGKATFYRYFPSKYALLTYLFHNKLSIDMFQFENVMSYKELGIYVIKYCQKDEDFFKNIMNDEHSIFLKLLYGKYVQIIDKRTSQLSSLERLVLEIYLNGTITTTAFWTLDDKKRTPEEIYNICEKAMPQILCDILKDK